MSKIDIDKFIEHLVKFGVLDGNAVQSALFAQGLILSNYKIQKIGENSPMQEEVEKNQESEDERIRKGLTEFLKNASGGFLDTTIRCKTFGKWAAWLEKQGEQKPTLEDAAKAFLEALSETPYNNTPIVEAQIITKQLLIFLSAPKSYNPDAINEQKPAENKGMNLVKKEMTPFQKKVFCIIDTAIEEEQGLKQVCDELLTLASNEIKQKPAEWSEEDELHIRELESLVKKAWTIAELKNDKETIHKMSDLAFFLKTLKPQLKREWSEEDYERYISCLKRLGTGNPDQPETINSKWFKEHVTSLPHWKPSEEQMKYLHKYAEQNNYDGTILTGLYNDLKQLKQY